MTLEELDTPCLVLDRAKVEKGFSRADEAIEIGRRALLEGLLHQ